MNNNNLFSVNIACYNSEKYLTDTIKSVINQSYKKWELILIDNGSVDNTTSIIKSFSKKYTNIKYFHENRKGLSYARNLGIRKSSSDWIVLLDHDDIMDIRRLHNHNININNIYNNEVSFFFGDAIYFNAKGDLYSRFEISLNKDNFNPPNLDLNKKYAFDNLVNYGCFIVSSTVCFNKKIINKVGFFDTKYKFISDYIFFLKVAEYFNLHCSSNILCKWRSHDDQSTNKLQTVYFFELNYLYLKFYFNNKISIYLKYKILIKNIRLILIFLKKLFLNSK